MIVKYIHHSDPKKEKTYNTVIALQNNPFVKMTQEEFDTMECHHFEQDLKKGYILQYEIVNGQ